MPAFPWKSEWLSGFWSSMAGRFSQTCDAPLKRVEKFSKDEDRSVAVFAGLVGAGQLARLQLRVGGGHQRAADQHGVDPDPVELHQLLASGDPALGDDGLARRHVRHQLEGGL